MTAYPIILCVKETMYFFAIIITIHKALPDMSVTILNIISEHIPSCHTLKRQN